MARIVVCEPFYAGSHKAWLDAWANSSRHEIDTLTLPGEFWRWRLRAGAITMADMFSTYCSENPAPDLVVVSTMVDVAVFCGIARASLGSVPVVGYMHENQLLYPTAPGRKRDDALALAAWNSAVAADEVWFNSQFHRQGFFAEMADLFDRQPEPSHQHLIEPLIARSKVVYPGAETASLIGMAKPTNQRPIVLWNQRWDHDKDPSAVMRSLVKLAGEGLEFDVILAGENNLAEQDLADWAVESLGERVLHHGFASRHHYLDLLMAADIVVGAAHHEFFGIAVVEAIAAGCVPVLPNRLSYPELVGPWQQAGLYGPGELGQRLREVIGDLDRYRSTIDGLRASMDRFDISNTTAFHDESVDSVLHTDCSRLSER